MADKKVDVKKVAEEAKKATETVKATAGKTAEKAKTTAEKATVSAEETAEKVMASVEKTAKKATATAKKATATAKKAATKKTTKKAETTKTAVLQFAGEDYKVDEIIERAIEAFKSENKRKAINDIKVYIKPEDYAAYYVVTSGDSEYAGRINL